ncbi:MAG: secretin N-terminal domain-containing protein [Myxococcaceae bacterium]
MRFLRFAVALCLFALPCHAAGPLVKRISLEVQRADIHGLLRMFAEVSRRNFVVGEEVSGSVTLSVRNVRWEDALDAVLATRALGLEKRGDIWRVAPLKQLGEEAEARARLEKAKIAGARLETRLVPVNYARAEDLVPKVKAMLSERGTVMVDARTNTLIITDVAP